MNINFNIVSKNIQIECLQIIRQLKLKEQFSKSDFNHAVFLMTRTENITGVDTLLYNLKHISGTELMINSRELLSIYMIYFFHTDVLSTHKNETEELLYEKCRELVYFIPDISAIEDNNVDSDRDIDFIIYIKKLNTFSVLFSIWKNKDYASQKDIYISMYIDYSEEIETFIQKATDINQLDYYTSYIDQLCTMKEKIKNCLIRLIGKEDFTQLEHTKNNPIGIFNRQSKNLVKEYVIEAYWNIFKKNIHNGIVQDQNILDNLYITVTDYFKHIYLSNEEKLEKIYKSIDFIFDKIKHTGNISDYIIDLIYLLYNELLLLTPEHSILKKVKLKMEELDTIDDSIYVLKILMKVFSTQIHISQ